MDGCNNRIYSHVRLQWVIAERLQATRNDEKRNARIWLFFLFHYSKTLCRSEIKVHNVFYSDDIWMPLFVMFSCSSVLFWSRMWEQFGILFNNYHEFVTHLHWGNSTWDLITFHYFLCEYVCALIHFWIACLCLCVERWVAIRIRQSIIIFNILKYVGYGSVYVNNIRSSWVSWLWFIAKDTPI